MNRYIVLMVAGILLLLTGLFLASSPAEAQISRPNPTATAKADPARILGVPQPSAMPTCGNAAVGLYADPNGCVYACTDGQRTILAGTTCVFPTPQATVTP